MVLHVILSRVDNEAVAASGKEGAEDGEDDSEGTHGAGC